ncbi:hypothetical protein V1478_001560 [Vespula squamosa]|uniref:Uncharacterized protein n=1 Tax=Vespula squamosa TaxID=30214 RepID=A0ABD2C1W8_VESSQ
MCREFHRKSSRVHVASEMIFLLGSFFAMMLINGELIESLNTETPLLLTTNFINTEKNMKEETTMPSTSDVAFRESPLGAIIVGPEIECDAGHKRDGNGICRPVTF